MRRLFRSLVVLLLVVAMLLPCMTAFAETRYKLDAEYLAEQGFVYSSEYYYCPEDRDRNVAGNGKYRYYCYKKEVLFPTYIFFDNNNYLVTDEQIIDDLSVIALANDIIYHEEVKAFLNSNFNSAATSLALKDVANAVLDVTSKAAGALSAIYLTGGTTTASAIAKTVASQTLDDFTESMTDVSNLVSSAQTGIFYALAANQSVLNKEVQNNRGSLNTYSNCVEYLETVHKMRVNFIRASILLNAISSDMSQGWEAVAKTLLRFSKGFMGGFTGGFSDMLTNGQIGNLKNLDGKTLKAILDFAKDLSENPSLEGLEIITKIHGTGVLSTYFTVLSDVVSVQNIQPYTTYTLIVTKNNVGNYVNNHTTNDDTEVPTPEIPLTKEVNSRTSKPAYTTDENVIFSWNSTEGAVTYGITVKNSDTGVVYVNRKDLTGTSLNIGKLPAGTYRFNMAGYNSNGVCGYIETVRYFTVAQPTSPSNLTDSEIMSHMKNMYQAALISAHMSSFNGYCGECVGQQLKVLGVNIGAKITPNGNDTYNRYASLSTTTGGYTVNKFPSSAYTMRQALDYLNALPSGYTYAALGFHTGSSSSAGQTYGHTLLIYDVKDGYVYYTECFVPSSESSECVKRSIDKFCASYSDRSSTSVKEYRYEGMILFTNPQIEDTVIPEDKVEYPEGWVDAIPKGDSEENYMQSTFYRYRDSVEETVYGNWSSNKTTTDAVEESDLVEIVSEGERYSYYHYCNNYYNGSYNVDSIPYGTGGVQHTIYTSEKMTDSNVNDRGGKVLYGGEAEYACPNGFRVWAENTPSTEHVYTYRTRSKTEKTVFTSWSDWSKAVPEETDGREIESVVLYKEISDVADTYPEGWVKEISEDELSGDYESKTFYRYRTSENKTVYGAWGESQTSTDPVTESDTLQLVSTNTRYNYYHYCNNYYNGSYNVDSIPYGTGGVHHTIQTSEKMTDSHVNDRGGKVLYGGEAEYACSNGFRVWAASEPFETVQYVYRTRSVSEEVGYTPWSDWSESVPEPAENMETESVVLYRSTDNEEALYPDGWIAEIPEGDSEDSYLSKTFYRYHTVSTGTEYGEWSDTAVTTDKIEESDTLKITSQRTLYSYYHYCNNHYNGGYYVDSIPYGTGGVYHSKLSAKKMTASNVGDRGGKTLYGGEAEFACSNGFRVWAENSPLEVTEYTYCTRAKTESTVCTPWSSWSEIKPEEAENRVVESIVLYTKWDNSVNVGTSLILDGSIGVRMYLDLAKEIARDAKLTVSVYDENSEREISRTETSPKYDSKKGLYYVTAFVAPKDAYCTEIRTVANHTNVDISFADVKISDYIDAFKDLAEENSEYANGIGLVNALETYMKYAEGFFGGETLDSVGGSIGEVTPPSKAGELAGVEHLATSLILEGNTTIRHYFNTNGGVCTFKLGDKILPAVYVGEDTVYVDIADISARDMDEIYTVTVNDTYSISYSVLNYVEQNADSENTNLANLMGVLYNYWYQAENYAD